MRLGGVVEEPREFGNGECDIRATVNCKVIEGTDDFLVRELVGALVVGLCFEKWKRCVEWCLNRSRIHHIEPYEHAFDVTGLVDRNRQFVADNVETKERCRISKILHVELLCEGFVDVVARSFIEAENEDIVDVHGDKDVAVCRVVDTCIGRKRFEAEKDDLTTQKQIPDTWGLFEAIK
jgi:hypothetical protein